MRSSCRQQASISGCQPSPRVEEFERYIEGPSNGGDGDLRAETCTTPDINQHKATRQALPPDPSHEEKPQAPAQRTLNLKHHPRLNNIHNPRLLPLLRREHNASPAPLPPVLRRLLALQPPPRWLQQQRKQRVRLLSLPVPLHRPLDACYADEGLERGRGRRRRSEELPVERGAYAVCYDAWDNAESECGERIEWDYCAGEYIEEEERGRAGTVEDDKFVRQVQGGDRYRECEVLAGRGRAVSHCREPGRGGDAERGPAGDTGKRGFTCDANEGSNACGVVDGDFARPRAGQGVHSNIDGTQDCHVANTAAYEQEKEALSATQPTPRDLHARNAGASTYASHQSEVFRQTSSRSSHFHSSSSYQQDEIILHQALQAQEPSHVLSSTTYILDCDGTLDIRPLVSVAERIRQIELRSVVGVQHYFRPMRTTDGASHLVTSKARAMSEKPEVEFVFPLHVLRFPRRGSRGGILRPETPLQRSKVPDEGMYIHAPQPGRRVSVIVEPAASALTPSPVVLDTSRGDNDPEIVVSGFGRRKRPSLALATPTFQPGGRA
ncbi:hypothetical protein LTR95_013166 [Oleoguttula sp. CCFEE 5521]